MIYWIGCIRSPLICFEGLFSNVTLSNTKYVTICVWQAFTFCENNAHIAKNSLIFLNHDWLNNRQYLIYSIFYVFYKMYQSYGIYFGCFVTVLRSGRNRTDEFIYFWFKYIIVDIICVLLYSFEYLLTCDCWYTQKVIEF